MRENRRDYTGIGDTRIPQDYSSAGLLFIASMPAGGGWPVLRRWSPEDHRPDRRDRTRVSLYASWRSRRFEGAHGSA